MHSEKSTSNCGVSVKQLTFDKNTKSAAEAITAIHMKAFPNFFLTDLGKEFLTCMYMGFCAHKASGILCAYEGNCIVGFAAYSENLSDLYRYLLRKKLLPFAWYSLKAFLKNPGKGARLLRAFFYPGKAKRKERHVTLSSIGVLPSAANRGVGSKLLGALKGSVNFDTFAYIKLETDAQNNDAVNAFYQKNGFVLHSTYSTPEGRKMNEYRYWTSPDETAL